jgi:hypothetical protein
MTKVNPNKCSAEEHFIASRNMANELTHKVVKDPNRKAKPVMALFRMTAGWIPQATDNIATTNSGDPSIKHWTIEHMMHDKNSWEALGIEKGKLPNTTMICPISGDEIYPPITMNGIIIDIESPEMIRRYKEAITFPPVLVHETLDTIEQCYLNHFEDRAQGVRKKGGPYDILLKAQ